MPLRLLGALDYKHAKRPFQCHAWLLHAYLHPCYRGYNIGVRLVDEFLAKAKQGRCSSFREAAEVIAKQALPMFLNVTASVANWSADGSECSLVSASSMPAVLPQLRSCSVTISALHSQHSMAIAAALQRQNGSSANLRNTIRHCYCCAADVWTSLCAVRAMCFLC